MHFLTTWTRPRVNFSHVKNWIYGQSRRKVRENYSERHFRNWIDIFSRFSRIFFNFNIFSSFLRILIINFFSSFLNLFTKNLNYQIKEFNFKVFWMKSCKNCWRAFETYFPVIFAWIDIRSNWNYFFQECHPSTKISTTAKNIFPVNILRIFRRELCQ